MVRSSYASGAADAVATTAPMVECGDPYGAIASIWPLAAHVAASSSSVVPAWTLITRSPGVYSMTPPRGRTTEAAASFTTGPPCSHVPEPTPRTTVLLAIALRMAAETSEVSISRGGSRVTSRGKLFGGQRVRGGGNHRCEGIAHSRMCRSCRKHRFRSSNTRWPPNGVRCDYARSPPWPRWPPRRHSLQLCTGTTLPGLARRSGSNTSRMLHMADSDSAVKRLSM